MQKLILQEKNEFKYYCQSWGGGGGEGVLNTH